MCTILRVRPLNYREVTESGSGESLPAPTNRIYSSIGPGDPQSVMTVSIIVLFKILRPTNFLTIVPDLMLKSSVVSSGKTWVHKPISCRQGVVPKEVYSQRPQSNVA
jgi:hypothetical protein